MSSSKKPASVSSGYAGAGGKPVSLVVGNNAARDLLDPYFVVAGKNKMNSWTAPLPLGPDSVIVIPGGAYLHPYFK